MEGKEYPPDTLVVHEGGRTYLLVPTLLLFKMSPVMEEHIPKEWDKMLDIFIKHAGLQKRKGRWLRVTKVSKTGWLKLEKLYNENVTKSRVF